MKGWGGFQMKTPMKRTTAAFKQATDESFPGGEPKSERDIFNDEETSNEMAKEEKAEHIFGQEIEVVGDGKYQIDVEDLGYGIAGLPDEGVVEVLDPDGILGNLEEGDFVADEDFTWEVEDGKVVITGERELEPGE